MWLLALATPLIFFPKQAGWIYILLLVAAVNRCTGIFY